MRRLGKAQRVRSLEPPVEEHDEPDGQRHDTQECANASHQVAVRCHHHTRPNEQGRNHEGAVRAGHVGLALGKSDGSFSHRNHLQSDDVYIQ